MPGTVVEPSPTVTINDPAPKLPDYPVAPSGPPPGGYGTPYVIQQDGTVIQMVQDPVTRAWTNPPVPTVGPSSDPDIPRALAQINYRPLTTARLGAPIPIGYGRFKTGGLIARAKKWGSELLVLVVWCEGEVDAVESVWSDGVDITVATQYAAYTGTQAQTGDTTIAAQFGQADDLKGICYSVLSLRAQDSLNLQAIIRGKKVYDPRTASTVYSPNAALCLADWIDNYTDWAVDWTSVDAAADYCDVAIDTGIKRWEVNMPLADRKSPEEWMAILAEYANCYVFIDGGTAKLLPDEARAVDHALTAADISDESFDLQKLGQRDTPTQVFCDYTLVPSTGEWTEDEQYTDDVPDGDPLRVTRLKMLGYQKAIQAKRKAVQFLNYANLADLTLSMVVFDKGAKITKGDVISVTHPIGLSAKEFRVLDCYTTSPGRWRVEGREYSPLLYSSSVVSNPNVPDSDLPDPTVVPDGPTPSEIREVLFTDQNNITYTRFEIRFDGVDWRFAVSYRVQMSAGSVVVMDTTIVHQGANVEHLVTTPPTAQGVLYAVKIWVVSTFNQLSATPGQATKTGNGKTIPPTDPSGLTGREAGQFVALNWVGSVDTDLRGYQVRRLGQSDYDAAGSSSARWDHANTVMLISLIDSTRCVIESQPVGAYVYMVKAVDFAGNYSVNFASKLINVTEDQSGVGLFHEADYDAGSSLNVYAFDSRRQEGVNGGDMLTCCDTTLGWEDLFTNSEALAEWEDDFGSTDRWTKYQGPAEIVSEWWDTGKDNNGQWNVAASSIVSTVYPITYYLQLVLEANYPPGTSEEVYSNSANGVARYIRARMGPYAGLEGPATTGHDLTIRLPIDFTFQGVRVFDSGTESVPGAGSQPLAVAFNKDFGQPPRVKAQLLGSTPGLANPDNVTTNGFDLYVWDTSGTEMAGTVSWTADGV